MKFSMKMKKKTKNAKETETFAAWLHERYPHYPTWLLYGELGAGKTTFVKGLGFALGLDKKFIKSPTFTFVNEYAPLVHYDLYRLEALDDLTRELLHEHEQLGKKIVIEWPEKIEHLIQTPHLKIVFSHKGGDQREIEVLFSPPLKDEPESDRGASKRDVPAAVPPVDKPSNFSHRNGLPK